MIQNSKRKEIIKTILTPPQPVPSPVEKGGGYFNVEREDDEIDDEEGYVEREEMYGALAKMKLGKSAGLMIKLHQKR